MPGGVWQQDYTAHCTEDWLVEVDAPDAEVFLREAERLQASLDLARGPLLRAALLTLGDGSQRLLIVVHHLVVDGVSWRVLVEDLQQAYRQLTAGQRVTLAPVGPASPCGASACRRSAPARRCSMNWTTGARRPQGSRQWLWAVRARPWSAACACRRN